MERITAHQFFAAWQNTIIERRPDLKKIWQQSTEFTQAIKGSSKSILGAVGRQLNLSTYEGDYYSLDAIFYKDIDLVVPRPINTSWFKNIRIAFEHENDFKSGLFKEVSHLAITNCDLRVLVTYPKHGSSHTETKNEMENLRRIILGNRLAQNIADEDGFLLIFGYENRFAWEGFVFKMDSWEEVGHFEEPEAQQTNTC
ncbi:MAG TPA: hypothetical protein VK174_04645 [Chitinophagales bacterium]|nr:hypothetical protein [Chitinophagales bacterium]